MSQVIIHANQFKATLKGIRKAAQQMKKLRLKKAKFAKRQAMLAKALKKDADKRERRAAAAEKLAIKQQKADERAAKKAAKEAAKAAKEAAKAQRAEERAAKKAAKEAAKANKKTYKPRRSKEEIAAEKAAKEERAIERALLRELKAQDKAIKAEERAAKKAAREELIKDKALKAAAKLFESGETRKTRVRRTKEEIQADIMKKEMERRAKFDRKFMSKYDLTQKAFRACVRAAKV